MVTEYNRNVLMRRRIEEAERKAEAGKVRASANPPDTAPPAADAALAGKESLTEQAAGAADGKPRKTDAEKLKKGRK